MEWGEHYKTFVKIENCPFFSYTINDRKRIKWAYIQEETHSPTAVETSKIYTFTYKIQEKNFNFHRNYHFNKYETSHIFTIKQIITKWHAT